MSDVAQWLGELGLGQYAAAFHDNDIEFKLLPRLTDEQLKELGVNSMGHRMKILAAIEKSSGQPGESLAGLEPSDDAKEPTIAQRVDAERRQLTVMFCDLVGSTNPAAHGDTGHRRGRVAVGTAAAPRVCTGRNRQIGRVGRAWPLLPARVSVCVLPVNRRRRNVIVTGDS